MNFEHLKLYRAASFRLWSIIALLQWAQLVNGQPTGIEVTVLGIAQDAGYPQIDCRRSCCKPAWQDPALTKYPACLGIIDRQSSQSWMVEATPSIKYQWQRLSDQTTVEGILITHAHVGHYSGLQELGTEMKGAKGLPVYVLPKMEQFLSNNGPWSQLVSLNNIALYTIEFDQPFQLNDRISCTAIKVPHRDEFSETAGYIISGPEKELLFIPDIDKWSKWELDIRKLLKRVDYALLDGTFFRSGELPNRDMSEVPHPFVEESIQLFSSLPLTDRSKVYFIHFNHTNPLIYNDPEAIQILKRSGMKMAQQQMTFSL